jgi:hypothetical protein
MFFCIIIELWLILTGEVDSLTNVKWRFDPNFFRKFANSKKVKITGTQGAD